MTATAEIPTFRMEADTSPAPLLEVENLRVAFALKNGQTLTAVDGVSLDIKPGEILGLVGESGSGKTVFATALLRLVGAPGRITNGTIRWQGTDLLRLGNAEMRHVRGEEIAMLFQNPQASLNPVYTVGSQLVSVIRLHQDASKKEARSEAVRLLRLVRISDAENRLDDYPNQFSGGMCQRIMLAMALACRPKLLIADEPTAALDVTIQAQIMDLLMEIRDEFDMSILMISHDLGVIARMCDRIAVLYLGRIVELAKAANLYSSPKHPYTQALLESVPVPDPTQRGDLAQIEGDVPSPTDIPSGCRFRTRCPEAFDACPEVDPELKAVEKDSRHLAACLLYQQPSSARQ